jgi:beta-phosphoglucomutase-like phosphatase (HAD superfamily)
MPPAGALIFKLEQTLFRADVDYSAVQELVKKEQSGEASPLVAPSLAATMLSLKKRLGKKGYGKIRQKAKAMAERTESQALGRAVLHQGAEKMLESVRDTGWWVVAASDLGKKPITDFLKTKSLSQYMNLVVARSRLDEERVLARRLRPVQTRLKTLSNSVYFCNSSREVGEAKALGMKCFVLPSPVEPFRTLYQAGPNGIILSLEEIPPLLSLPTMKLPELAKPAARGRALRPTRKGAAKPAPRTP